MQKSKILAFLLALVVSIVLWFYAVTVVNPDDTITISGISVQFEGTEALTSQGLMLTGGDSTKVSIKVSGRRSDLKELNNETVTAIADVTRIAASGSYQLSWSVVWPSTVATGDISETSRAPSRISVTVSDIKENPEVPIELEYTGEPKTGYMIDKSNLTLGTQSISVRGPAEEVNKIARAVVRVDVTDADALIDTDCPVVLLDKDGNELSLSQYVTSSADSVRVTIPILQYKDIKLNATLISGGGATSEDAEVTIEPSTLRVTGNTAVLDAMADELTIRTIDLAQITGTETFEVTPELPSGVTSRADSQTVKITVTLKGLVTKEFTVPTANILRKEAPAGMTFADQNVKITVRGRASVMSTLRMEDLTVTADFSRHYDAAAKPGRAGGRAACECLCRCHRRAIHRAGLAERDGRRQYGVLTMRQRATVGSLLPDGSVSLLVQRVSACTGDCGHCGGCGAVGQSVQVTARAPFPVEPGERVWVESRSGAVLGAAALVYLLPLGLLLAVCLAAQSLGGVWMAVLGAAAFAVGLIPALLWNRHLRRRPMEFRITGRVD